MKIDKELLLKQSEIVVYVDGGYDTVKKHSKYGLYMVYRKSIDEEIAVCSDSGIPHVHWRYLSRQISGELYAVYYSLQILKEIDYKGNILFVYDYYGIEKWFTKEWKRKTDIAKLYDGKIHNIIDDDKISFYKIKGHRKITSAINDTDRLRIQGNMIADTLA